MVVFALDLGINPFHLLFKQSVLHCQGSERVAQVHRVIHIDGAGETRIPVLIERGSVIAGAQ